MRFSLHHFIGFCMNSFWDGFLVWGGLATLLVPKGLGILFKITNSVELWNFAWSFEMGFLVWGGLAASREAMIIVQ